MTGWVADQSDFSPDRLDALVHGLAQLGIGGGGFSDAFFASVAPPCPHCDLPNNVDSTHCSGCGQPLQ